MTLTSAQVTLIKEAWAKVETLPATTVGGLLFKHIFEQANVSTMFSFGRRPGFDPSPDAVVVNPDVQKHGAKVAGTVAIAISMLTDLEALVPILKELGAKHATYGVVAAHYDVVGSAFLKTLSVGLGPVYTPDVAAAYTAMWGVVATTMQAGAEEALKPSWGGYATPSTPEMKVLTKASSRSAMDWYTNPVACARGRA